MADDIDIEEHDVLDNPAIKDMFPDISALKEEIKMFEEGAQELVMDDDDDDPEKKKSNLDEKIIENSKPIINYSFTHDVVVIEDDVDIDPTEIKSQDSTFNNKIILGSKPTKNFEFEEDVFEQHVKSYEVSVVLDDLKSYLDASGRFCNDCLILFPQKHDLETHVNSYHIAIKGKVDDMISERKRYECHQCNISYAFKKNLTMHNNKHHIQNTSVQGIEEIISNVKNNIQETTEMSDSHCFHCQKAFTSQKSLIEHLYGILQSKKNVCEVCSESFTSSEELTKHSVIHKKCLIVVEKVPDQHDHKTINKRPTRVQSNPISEENLKTAAHHSAAMNSKTEMLSTDESCEHKYYKCYICSFYYTYIKYYVAHMANKHNIKEDTDKLVKEKFDGVCKFCSTTYGSMQSFNLHLQKSHKEDICRKIDKINQEIQSKKTRRINPSKTLNVPKSGPSSGHVKQDIVIQNKTKEVKKSCDETRIEPVGLKSVLFKCSKCDIHFLSSKVAQNHGEHTEMLINWKCLICKHIFKKEDKVLHEEQHKHTEKFTVHELCPITSSPVLFNCQKCGVHFNEENFLHHYTNCESATPDSVFCIICDILIDSTISKTHRSEHVSKNLKPSDFILVNTDVLVKCNRKGKSKNLEVKEVSSITKIHNELKRKTYESCNIPQKRKNNTDRVNLSKLNYCNFCKCYLTDSDKLEVHFKEHCHLLKKNICRICGLTLTEESFTTVHRNIHNQSSSMKLNDLRFYDLKSGKPITPPVPKYSKCDNCNVHLIPDGEHNCLKTDYLTCHICNINLTEHAFALHMQFHKYSITNRVSSTETNEETISIEKVDNISKNSRPLLHDYMTRAIRTNATKKSQENKTEEIVVAEKINDVNNSKNDKPLSKMNSTKLINLDGIIYQCRNCCIFLDTYTKVIEHCHEHYANKEDYLETAECNICNITLEKSCLDRHQNLHLSHKNKDFFTSLIFDTFYFASNNSVWIEHIFETLSPEQRDTIINESIYKYECRVKMEVIQNGPADLTVYKCDKCRSFIGGSSIYKHAENSCFKLRRHPCSICGLGFNSSIARVEHEKIHKTPNINLKSYRIVTFNKEEDKVLNKLIFTRSQYHVLYQCRTCSQAVDKSQTKNHKCHEQGLKACSLCALMIANDDYDNHVHRHNILRNFIPKNIKIILFGEILENIANDELDDKISFTGIIYDYTFYCCTVCQVCVKSNTNLDKHVCCLGSNRLKCSICKLYFATSRLKHHIKLHETDPDFLRENMRLVMFNAPEDISTDVETVTKLTEPAESSANETFIQEESENQCQNDKHQEQRPITMVNNDEGKIQNDSGVEHKSTKIYKCRCGLHFLEAPDIISHYKVCEQKSRAARQQCTKCDLLFTSDVLFNHLLLHHGNKTHIYKYEIVDFAMNNIIYRCTKCKIHFANVHDINKHLKIGCGGITDGKDCIFCHLKFESFSFLTHDCNNVNNVNAGIEVLDLDEPLISKTDAAQKNMIDDSIYLETMGSNCENKQIEMLEKDVKSDDNAPLTIPLENNQDKQPNEQPEQLNINKNNDNAPLTISLENNQAQQPKEQPEQLNTNKNKDNAPLTIPLENNQVQQPKEQPEQLNTNKNNDNAPLIIPLENNQAQQPNEQPEQLNTNKNQTETSKVQSDLDIELPSSTFEMNVSEALNIQPGPSTNNQSYERELVSNQPIQVCITTSSTQLAPSEPRRPVADSVTGNESNKHRQVQRPFYKRPQNSGRGFKHDYRNQYHNNMGMPPRWPNNQNRRHHNNRGHRPRGQVRPVHPRPPNQYQNTDNRFYNNYRRDY